MPQVYHLVRRCSDYTEDHITLGVFRTPETAQQAKSQYIAHLAETGDPHADQAYMTVDLDEDVEIEPIESDVQTDDIVYLVFETASAFGQGHRRLRLVTQTVHEAESGARSLHAQDLAAKRWLCEWLCETVRIDALRFENAKDCDCALIDVSIKESEQERST